MLSGFVEILSVRFKQQVFITFVLFRGKISCSEPFAELILRQLILLPSLTLPIPFPLGLLSLCMCAVCLPRGTAVSVSLLPSSSSFPLHVPLTVASFSCAIDAVFSERIHDSVLGKFSFSHKMTVS